MLKEHKAKLNVQTINMSKSEITPRDFAVTGYPTFRLYSMPNIYEEYKGKNLNVADLLAFLKRSKAIKFDSDMKFAQKKK